MFEGPPPFPDDVPTHPLFVIDYSLIDQGDEAEKDRLWQAATQLGFWYLKNHGAELEVEAMFSLGRTFMQLPLHEKLAYEEGDDGMQFGYKAAGYHTADEHGTLDETEFLDVAKDDVLAFPEPVHRTYPPLVADAVPTVLLPFMRKSLAVNHALLAVLNEKLELEEGTLAALHQTEEKSGCVSRVIRTPPQTGKSKEALERQALLGAHTDFGSLSFLHNRLGGLQVLAPGTEDWMYIKPIPGHAICNVGDALNIFSGGLIRSNMHRVVSPPRAQAQYERYSLAFFTRPHDSVVLQPLVHASSADAAQTAQEDKGTAGEWLVRRLKYLRTGNYHGVESYTAHLGTEEYDRIAQAQPDAAVGA
ncbi:Clavaminate synthase-like protein [Daedalea quercina L-15889]|uniref:Clavaminate synthase-like protein n=1 Tax=Daedalea quercina L-15889 TaxID=1314783 RepID=A0A165MJJ4_9APHY|nr:Clavaminate synthase-like protein [Daedalea quercina L-15889]